MKAYPSLRRFLSLLATVAVFAAVLAVVAWSGRPGDADRARADQAKAEAARTWPMFGGSLQRNMVNTFETGMPTEWAVGEGQEKNIKWSADLGSKAYGGPTIAGGKIFIGTNNEKPRDPKVKGDKGIVMCFRESDGKFLWQHVHDKLAAGRVNDWPLEGICSSPLVEGDRLYYVNNRCEVICSDTDGNIKWKLDMIGKFNVFPHNLATCSPLIVGDTLYVVTSNGVDEGHINIPQPGAPSFIAVDKKNGDVKWTSNLPSVQLVQARAAGKDVSIERLKDEGLILMHGQWSNPVYAEANGKPQIIFPGGDGWLRAFEPGNGKPIWQCDCNPKDAKYRLGPRAVRSDFVATPVVYENKVYIGTGQDPEHKEGVGHLWCIDITKEGDVSSTLVVDDKKFPPETKENPNSGIVWHFGGPADPDKAGGRNYYFGRSLSTCAVHDGLLYTADLDGYVYCLDAKTGKKYWDHSMEAQCWSSPYWVDGKVYMGNDGGTVHIFAHGKEKKLLAEVSMDTLVRATPVAANGVLYVMTENKLYAIKKKD
jgi:outer membrane protein assembly factor BamB